MCRSKAPPFRVTEASRCAFTVKEAKKPIKDPTDLKSYRAVSRLSFFLSKVIKKLVENRFNVRSGLFNLLSARQSTYRQFNLTETPVTVVHNGIVRAIDSKQLSLLVLLNLS